MVTAVQVRYVVVLLIRLRVVNDKKNNRKMHVLAELQIHDVLELLLLCAPFFFFLPEWVW